MDDCELESLAVKEIIEEIERKNRIELESRRPPQRLVRPNKHFLGRTIVSALQHNRRQYAQERSNSYKKLKELDRKRRRSRSRSEKHRSVRERPVERFKEVELDTFSHELQNNLTMYFLSKANQFLNKPQNISKKVKKEKNKIRTIDLTKKKKHVKKKHEKRKSRSKTIKSKKRRRRNSSSSVSSSSSSACAVSDTDSESRSSDCSKSATLLIDLTWFRNVVLNANDPKAKQDVIKAFG